MEWLRVLWDVEPGGNAEHVADHGLDIDEVEHVLRNPKSYGTSRGSGYPMVFGYTPAGEYIAVVYEELDDDTVYPLTAFPIED
ncbi:MAG: hypothetical protein KKE86_14725 [Planctomycetes bacterium]|nr:hypothetical protein [Planctomycetota bacterium]MBU4400574.1 hypothetical protein [Planctomycetota bacterium]MCG2682856.1 hypothetical protein [Planctomycetales bacterium]